MKVTQKNIINNFAFLFIFLFIGGNALIGQTVILERELAKDTAHSVFGPNERHYVHFMLGFGFVLGPSSEGLPMRYGISNDYSISFVYKLKLSNRFALGLDLNYRRTWYIVKQEREKIFPDTIMHDKQRFTVPEFNINLFARINFDKHNGKKMGFFMDIGGGLDVPFGVMARSRDKDSYYGNSLEVVRSDLKYMQPVYATSFLRLGYNRYMLRFSYRLSNIFKQSEINFQTNGLTSKADLARFTLGFEIGIY